MKKILKWIGIALGIVLLAAVGFLWLGVYHPRPVETARVTCPQNAPELPSGQELKVLTWNVQTMSGKDYVFWSDVPTEDGPDDRPSPEAITRTLAETARVIIDEDPDIILLQELDNGADRTDNENQLERLLELLPEEYACYSAVFDWKAAYVPHSRIGGSVGWMVAVVSKYKIDSAERFQLDISRDNWLVQQFRVKPAVLIARMPVSGGGTFAALTVHFDVYVEGSDAKDRQVKEVLSLLTDLNAEVVTWVFGGDFNLLPPNPAAHARLIPSHQSDYNPVSEIGPLLAAYPSVPNMEEVTGANFADWFTRFPNDPALTGPDRTLDYIFFPVGTAIDEHYVRQYDTLAISDHLPVVASFEVP